MEEHDRLTDATEIIFYEMPKLEQRVQDILAGKTDTEILSGEEKWCMFMKYRHEDRAGKLIEELFSCRWHINHLLYKFIRYDSRARRKAS
jgi:hypothetical protein